MKKIKWVVFVLAIHSLGMASEPQEIIENSLESHFMLENSCFVAKENVQVFEDSGMELTECRNQSYCKKKGLKGSGKWICSPAGAGQKSKCFRCK